MARRRKGPKAIWKCHISEELALRTELRYLDPITKRPDYGARSRLVEQLLTIFDEVMSKAEDERPEYVKDKLEQLLEVGKYAT